jgi:multidrug resistance protein, MATE family
MTTLSGKWKHALRERWAEDGGYRELLALAIPLILTTGAWSVQQFVDRMFLAWYSPEAIAASVPSGLLNFSIMSLFIGTASYVSTFVAQYYGSGQHHRIGPVVWQGVYISIIGGLFLLALIPLAGPIFRIVGHDPVIRDMEITYFQYLCLGSGPRIAANALAGFFSGQGRTWPIMWVEALTTLVNLVLDYLLIFGHAGFPEMGIKGAALATSIAAVFSFVAFLVLMITGRKKERFHVLSGWRPDRKLLKRVFRFGFPAGAEFFCDMASFTIFILIVGRLGTVSLAATNIALNIDILAFMPMIGCGMAVTVLVGQYLGRNRPDLAEKSTYSGLHLTMAYMVIMSLGFLLIPDLFILPFTAEADSAAYHDIHALVVILLRFVAVFGIFDALNIIFVSAIKGAGDTRFMMWTLIIVGLSGMVLPVYIAVVVFGLGLYTAWFIVTVYVAILGTVFWIRFLGGKWKTMRVIEKARDVTPSPR